MANGHDIKMFSAGMFVIWIDVRVQGIFTYFFLKIFPCVCNEMKIRGFDGPLNQLFRLVYTRKIYGLCQSCSVVKVPWVA